VSEVKRWVGTSAAARIWGAGVCQKTMLRRLEEWYDAGYAIGCIERTPGGQYRVLEEFIQSERKKKGTTGTRM
jgi:hypothetical protein